MQSLVYVFVLILIVGWLIGVFMFHLGSAIHVLLVIALVVFVLKTFGERKTVE
jgi:hypothetical protein